MLSYADVAYVNYAQKQLGRGQEVLVIISVKIMNIGNEALGLGLGWQDLVFGRGTSVLGLASREVLAFCEARANV